ncbi:hypothetical protein [Paenibacillus alkalitolerans]|uniref:hypothetical protein n=1 Tax=Paenibacillus alkalitolerans TaxID=2799335 RepID=UPI0018F764F9|nr:hypothetical protein [Paenibacillus alkalitolerans]
MAVKYAAKHKVEQRADSYLDLIEPLLFDQNPYVKKNVGPFAIGDGLLKYFPDRVLERMGAWVLLEDEYVRWNLAKAFSSAAGRILIAESSHIISQLQQDNRPVVRERWPPSYA